MSTAGMYANRVGGSPKRRPRTFDEGRICANADCQTIISRYNSADFCFRHAPPKFRRLRGVVTEHT
jgi:hypothetical protein